MSCTYTYNNQIFTKDELLEYLREEMVAPTNKRSHFSLGDKIVAEGKKSVRKEDKTGYVTDGQERLSVTTKLKDFTTRPIKDDRTLGQAEAAYLFKNMEEGARRLTSISSEPLTEQEYAEKIDQRVEKGKIKGTLYHSIFQHHIDESLTRAQVTEMITNSGFYEVQFQWLFEDVPKIIYYKMGTDVYSRYVVGDETKYIKNPDAKDKMYSEVTIDSPELGITGTLDVMIDHGDNLLSIFDIKSGASLNRLYETYLFEYGDTSTLDIFDNPLNRAKAQVMLYAIMLKIKNPEVRFKTLKPLHVKDRYSIYRGDEITNINIPAFLEMFENYYKNKEPKVYEKLKELEHFNTIFNPETYSVTTTSILDKPSDPAMDLEIKNLQLQSLLLEVEGLETKLDEGTDKAKQIQKKIKDLMKDILELKSDKSISYASTSGDISWMDHWMGSGSSSTNPYVQLYYDVLNTQKNKAERAYLKWESVYDKLLKKVIDASSARGIVGSLTGNLAGGYNKQELFRFAYKFNKDNVITRYVTETDPEWKNLTKEQQDYLEHVHNGIEQFFKNDKSNYIDPRTGKKVALANKQVTERETSTGKTKQLTNLDLYNFDKGLPFQYSRGFMPKVAPQLSDIVEKHGYLSSQMLQYLKNKYLTYYFEATYDSWFQQQELIPMKYLGNKDIIDEQAYTLDMDFAVKTFMRDYFYKQELDEVYTYGKALQIYLQALEDTNDVSYEHLIKWFEESVQLHVLGRRDTSLKLTKRELKIKSSNKGFMKFNWTKFLRSLKTFFAGPVMWLSPISGLANFVFATTASIKEGVKNSISSRTFVDDGRILDFTAGDIAEGFGIAIKTLIADVMLGTYKDSKAFQLMERYRMFNNSYDWYVAPNKLLTSNNRLFSTNSMYFFHSYPEEVISMAIFIAQMKSLKHEGKSVWDMYKEETYKDEYGNTHKKYVWDGTVRGKRKLSNITGIDQFQDITEPTPEELAAMKYGYEQIHGGYKHDERIAAEYYLFGELMFQFKKYLPSILKNGFASKGKRYTQGYFKDVTDANGNTYKQWTPDVIEGRFRVLAGVIITWLGHRWDSDSKNPLAKFFGNQASSMYKWENLSVRQKDAVLDAGLTMMTFLLMITGAGLMWDRDDEKNSWYKVYDRITRDVAGQWYLPELSKNVVNISQPVVAKKAYKLVESSADLGMSLLLDLAGYDDQAVTQQGNYRGMNEFKRNWHFISSWHKIRTFIENDEELDNYFNLRQK